MKFKLSHLQQILTLTISWLISRSWYEPVGPGYYLDEGSSAYLRTIIWTRRLKQKQKQKAAMANHFCNITWKAHGHIHTFTQSQDRFQRDVPFSHVGTKEPIKIVKPSWTWLPFTISQNFMWSFIFLKTSVDRAQ